MKNKIIKLLTLILSVAVVVAFTACGAKEEDKKETPIKRDTLTVLEEIRDLLAKRKLS